MMQSSLLAFGSNMRPDNISDNSMTTFRLMLDMVYLQWCCPLQSVAALQNIAN